MKWFLVLILIGMALVGCIPEEDEPRVVYTNDPALLSQNDEPEKVVVDKGWSADLNYIVFRVDGRSCIAIGTDAGGHTKLDCWSTPRVGQ